VLEATPLGRHSQACPSHWQPQQQHQHPNLLSQQQQQRRRRRCRQQQHLLLLLPRVLGWRCQQLQLQQQRPRRCEAALQVWVVLL
jgi:hypothetical protein